MSQLNPVDVTFRLMYELKKSIHRQMGYLDCSLNPGDINVLKEIASHDGNITANEIANLLNRDKAQITRILILLIKENMIEKQANPNDKRSQFLVMTNRGKAIHQQISKVDQLMLEQLGEGLSKQELQTFQNLAEKMILNLEV
ncbi:MarR family winged helix-turn-helix transcriptional regulator [Marinicellulosiphila megalodicopiae]|uniref:MarR family winged helix-turn-helix transcriptional regulator n=1 Tax=Marinicellulosiphila megalodicopiae TaxID=2724896 RepID=UPI003BB1538F